jgi:uncharacterized protein YqjF (DUF2071 family)
MAQPRVFLTAEWKQLLMLNYAVDPALLLPFLPAGTEIDSFEGRPYVSLVGFQFNDTRVAGFAIPFHRSFEEVNLRFYVRRAGKRGVVFMRELVPKIAIAATARLFYGEKYSRVPMAHRIRMTPGKTAIEAEYSWGTAPRQCAMRIETTGENYITSEGSLSQFITEHYWGYAAQSDGGCIEYEVQHPRWSVSDAKQASFSGDGTHFYGQAFGKVLMRPPDSAFLAEGSAVKVFRGTRIR